MVADQQETHVILKELKGSLFTLKLRDNGIVQLNTDDNAYFTINEAKEYVVALEKITKGIPHLILKVPGIHASVDNETRSYMATHEALRFSISEAVVVRNLGQRILGNFYLKFDKPIKLVRLFDNIENGEKWLLDFASRVKKN